MSSEKVNNPCFDFNNFRGVLVPILNKEYAKLLLDRLTGGEPLESLPSWLHALVVRLKSAVEYVPTDDAPRPNRPAFNLSGFHGTVVLVANQAFAEQLLDAINVAEDAEERLTPPVYTFAEKLDEVLENKGRSPLKKKDAA